MGRRTIDEIVEAFLERHPAPTATQILAERQRDPEASREITEASMVANALSLFRSPVERDHEVDARDVEAVRSASRRRGRGSRIVERNGGDGP